MEGIKMSKITNVSRWDTAEFLNDSEDIYEYLLVAFESGDARQITKALGNVAKVMGITDIARKTGLTREHLYTSLSENGNPTLQTLTTIINTMGFHLSVVPNK